jgi:hypothetical protein
LVGEKLEKKKMFVFKCNMYIVEFPIFVYLNMSKGAVFSKPYIGKRKLSSWEFLSIFFNNA